jgi:hypothetical protein
VKQRAAGQPGQTGQEQRTTFGLGCQPAEQPGYVGGEGGYDGNSDSA